jgi:hypothetical protein
MVRACNVHEKQEADEMPVVIMANAVIYPRAMMIFIAHEPPIFHRGSYAHPFSEHTLRKKY